MQGEQTAASDGTPTTAAGGATPDPPPSENARRWAMRAAIAQLVSPFVFTGMLVAGLVWDIPTPRPHSDPHGYFAIFSFLGSLMMMVLAIVVAGAAALLLQSSRRWGGVLLAIAAALACLESLGLATGFPTGIGALAPVRVVTIAVGVLWFAVSAASFVLGVRAFRTIAPRPVRLP